MRPAFFPRDHWRFQSLGVSLTKLLFSHGSEAGTGPIYRHLSSMFDIFIPKVPTGEFITSLGFLLQEMGQRKLTPGTPHETSNNLQLVNSVLSATFMDRLIQTHLMVTHLMDELMWFPSTLSWMVRLEKQSSEFRKCLLNLSQDYTMLIHHGEGWIDRL